MNCGAKKPGNAASFHCNTSSQFIATRRRNICPGREEGMGSCRAGEKPDMMFFRP